MFPFFHLKLSWLSIIFRVIPDKSPASLGCWLFWTKHPFLFLLTLAPRLLAFEQEQPNLSSVTLIPCFSLKYSLSDRREREIDSMKPLDTLIILSVFPPLPLVKNKKFSSDKMDHCVFCCFWKGDTPPLWHHRSGVRAQVSASPVLSSAAALQNWLTQGQEPSRWEKSLQRLGSPQSRLDLFQLPRSNMLAAGFEFYLVGPRASCFCTASSEDCRRALTPARSHDGRKNGPRET